MHKLIIGLVLLISANILHSKIMQDPNIKDSHATNISVNQEKHMGRILMQELRASGSLLQDPIINEYLKFIGNSLLSKSPKAPYQYHFFAINDSSINAFAFFGGYIGINYGLILLTANESQLAAVIAHEIAHITQHHLTRIIQANKKLLPITIAEIIAALAIGTVGSPEASIHLIYAVLAGYQQQLINYTRSHEKEADRIGMQILASAGFNPQAMPNFFHKMSAKHFHINNTLEYLSTHPLYENRIADTQNRAAQFPYWQPKESILYHLIKARLKIHSLGPLASSEYFADRLDTGKYNNKIANEYGYAISLLHLNNLSEAKLKLQSLVKKLPTNWLFNLAIIDLEIANNNFHEALAKTERLLALHTNNLPLTLRQADILISLDKVKTAEIVLSKQLQINHDNMQLYELMAKVKNKLNKISEMHNMRAEWYLIQGDFQKALQQIEIAINNVANNNNLLAILKHRKQEILSIEKIMSPHSHPHRHPHRILPQHLRNTVLFYKQDLDHRSLS